MYISHEMTRLAVNKMEDKLLWNEGNIWSVGDKNARYLIASAVLKAALSGTETKTSHDVMLAALKRILPYCMTETIPAPGPECEHYHASQAVRAAIALVESRG